MWWPRQHVDARTETSAGLKPPLQVASVVGILFRGARKAPAARTAVSREAVWPWGSERGGPHGAGCASHTDTAWRACFGCHMRMYSLKYERNTVCNGGRRSAISGRGTIARYLVVARKQA